MFVTNWISTTKIQKISEITNFFRHYFLSRTEVIVAIFLFFIMDINRKYFIFIFYKIQKRSSLCNMVLDNSLSNNPQKRKC